MEEIKVYNGIITKAIGGFYYVETADAVYECKARGAFRKNGISPCVGDRAVISVPADGYASVEEIKQRKNVLVRPPIANLDLLFIVASVTEPDPSPLVIDKITAAAVSKNIEPVIVFSKTDLAPFRELADIYRMSGFKVVCFSSIDGTGTDEICSMLEGKLSAFTGNSGVGKSTIMNTILPELKIETGDISKKLGRGRHTTRHTELYKAYGGYIADTPGFSTVDIERYELIKKEELPNCFPDFADYIGECRFTSCSHTCEKGCAVLKAVNEGKIAKSRHNSYIKMYEEVKNIKDWMNK